MTTTGKRNTGKAETEKLLRGLHAELERLDATDAQLSLDEDFEPEAGRLVKVEIGLAFWHLIPSEFQVILRDLPDNSRSEAIKQAIETRGLHVWHGHSPKPSRESTR